MSEVIDGATTEMMFPIPMKVLEELAELRSKQREAYREKRERLRKLQQEWAATIAPPRARG